MTKYEYLIIFIVKNGFGRIPITLEKPITDMEHLLQLDNALREQSEKDGERDDTLSVINYKLLKTYTI